MYIERELAKSEWFAGSELSGADIQMSFPLEGLAASASLAGASPRIEAFIAKIHARPAYQRALERGGPYSFGVTSRAR